MKNKTILEKIGITNKIVKKWKRDGLKITYPTKQNPRWFKSADGEVFIENADKFVPPLTEKETKKYINSPKKFREDFQKNLRFFRKFCDYVYEKQKLVDKLKNKEKIAALLSLIYVFQRAMDYHYYHWDRYLVYEDYPQTPVGYWWKKVKDLYTKATKKKVSKKSHSEDFLKIIARDKEILREFRERLSKNDFLILKRGLQAIKIFEDAQQKEIEILMDYKRRIDVLKGTGLPMLDKFWKEIKRHPELIKREGLPKIRKIMKLHPIIGARRLLLASALKCFDKEIFLKFKREIKKWLK